MITFVRRTAVFAIAALFVTGCTRTDDKGGPTGSTSGSTSASGAGGGGGGAITMKGSDTMVILGQRWAENYMKKNTNFY
jgi:ABC-type phosphate transport system substrate-binding protein